MRRILLFAFVSASPVLALAAPAAAQEATPVAFGSWTGLCVGGGLCSLSAFSDAQGPIRPGAGVQPAYRLSLLRRPGSIDDDLIFTPIGGAVQPGSLIEIRLDGALISRLGPTDGWTLLEDGAPNEVQAAPSIFQIDLLPRMRAASALSLHFTGDDGRERQANFSLNGFSTGQAWLGSPR